MAPSALPRGNKKENIDFLMKEYEESANSYFNGVEIGINYIRSFILLNAVLLTGFATCWTIISDGGDIFPLIIIIFAICSIGLASSILLYRLVPAYDEYYNICISRAVEIEKIYNGNLFHMIYEVGRRKNNSTSAIRVFIRFFFITWLMATAVPAYQIYLYVA